MFDIVKALEVQLDKEKLLEFYTSGRTTRFGESMSVSVQQPLFVYKYFAPTEYNICDLENNLISFTIPEKFNDPYDCSLNLAYYKDEILQNKLNSIKKRVYISCFSELNDSMLMWAHYAINHTGFCVQYQKSFIDTLGFGYVTYKNITNLICPVIYTQKVNLNPWSEKWDFQKQILKALFYKSDDWIYEQEWRNVILFPSELKYCYDELGDDFKEINKDYMKLYMAGNDRIFLKVNKIESVFLGCKMDKKIEERIIDICKTKNIPYFKMHLDDDSFILHKD